VMSGPRELRDERAWSYVQTDLEDAPRPRRDASLEMNLRPAAANSDDAERPEGARREIEEEVRRDVRGRPAPQAEKTCATSSVEFRARPVVPGTTVDACVTEEIGKVQRYLVTEIKGYAK